MNNTRKDAGEREVNTARGQTNKEQFCSRERAEKAQKKIKNHVRQGRAKRKWLLVTPRSTTTGGERGEAGCLLWQRAARQRNAVPEGVVCGKDRPGSGSSETNEGGKSTKGY